MAYSRRKSSTRRAPSRSRRSSYGSARRSTDRSTRRASTRARSRASSGPRTVIIRLETAGAAPVRDGTPVSMNQKVAKAPRVKPKF